MDKNVHFSINLLLQTRREKTMYAFRNFVFKMYSFGGDNRKGSQDVQDSCVCDLSATVETPKDQQSKR